MNDTTKKRCDQLFDLNMIYNGKSYIGNHDMNKDFNVHWTEIATFDDDKWDTLIKKLSNEFNDRIA
jgi:hypothetical protein|tara:strand:- start:14936 stop:15133 length:198 start_codon:yes stop_codon:yes gene_type:complete